MLIKQRGFTLTEILIVLSLLVILSVSTLVVFQTVAEDSALRTSAQEVYSVFADARTDTLASKNDTVYGVHVSSTEMIYFVGDTYTPSLGTNVSYPLSRNVTATSSLTGGATEVIFERLTGNTSASGTITVTESGSGASTTLTLYLSGLIEL